MQLPRFRFTMKRMMTAVLVLGVLTVLAIDWFQRIELRHTWSFWPMRDASESDVSERVELSQQELAEIDLKVKKMGFPPIW
jgi:hypothetical protein